MGSWECGHIKSEANGGDLNTNNLKPICSGCNKSMGSKNMDDYMREFYPKRYEKILLSTKYLEGGRETVNVWLSTLLGTLVQAVCT